ncbi:MAG: hypothetical protein K2N30_05120 [Clostridia bacterium]|nr:hypothetical protein [Clostridia bacterium]
MKETERRKIFEKYEQLRMEVADGKYWRIGDIINLVHNNKIGNTQYWIDKLCKTFLRKLNEKAWDAAFTIACTELGTLLPEDVEIFRLTGNADKRNELRKQLAEALENEIQSGNGTVRKKLSETYLQLGEVDKAKRLWRQLAEGGNPIAQYELGRIYYYYPEKNKIAAYEWFKKAANGGYEDACDMVRKIENKPLEIPHYSINKKLRDKENVSPEHSALEYNVLRGKDKIGENLIEISYGDTKILVELGKSLDGCDETFEQKILDKPYSAVVVSHYHEDHAGLIKQKRDCPAYMGQGTYCIIKAMGGYHGEEMPKNIEKYYNGETFRIGRINITPFLCDHSAYDSYMLLFEAGGKSILYTGDFRFHGRKDKYKLLAALPESVDVLIHEGTNIGKNSCMMKEAELEAKAVEIMNSSDNPVFVLQSGTNIDRLVSFYRASKRSGRLTYMDIYTSHIASAAGGSIPRPDVFKDVIAFTPRAVHGKRAEIFMEILNKRGLQEIANGTKRFTMLVRPSMCEYIKKLLSTAHISGATLVYSMWKGYKENDDMKEFLSEMHALGLNIVDLHTSGHASAGDIELLKKTVNAKETVCVHTEG